MSVPPPRVGNTPWGLIVGVACGGCLVMLILAATGGYFLFRAGSEAYNKVDPVARTFMNHVFAGEADSAYAMVSSEWKRRSSREQFKEWADFCRKSMGGSPEAGFTGYNFFSGTSGRQETITYRLTRGDHSGQMQVSLVRESGEVRILSATFNASHSGNQP